MTKPKRSTIPIERVESKILVIRGQRVMLDSDLAEIYGIETKNLNKAVKRNLSRFPEDFIFQLAKKEFENLKFQIGTSSAESTHSTRPQIVTAAKEAGPNLKSQIATSSWGGKRKLPYAFTEHGAVMLASVLNSPTAIQASIFVVRDFIQLRQLGAINANLAIKIAELEDKYGKHDIQIQKVIKILRQLLEPPIEPTESEKEPIGFRV
jgi:hypothetical protein